MSAQIEISIIIPTYNLEKYIGATLESVILQDDVTKEVLVIDDSSTDRTREIIQAYAVKYPYIKLLNNENMKGVSGARNTGIAHMQGEKCFFLDGDDLLPPNALKALATCMNESNAPIVRGTQTIVCHQRWLYFRESFSEQQKENIYPTATFALHLYSVAFIKNNAILFPEGCSAGEDRTFFCHAFSLLPATQTIPAIDFTVYIYRINHKKTLPNAQHALSYARHFTYIREYLEKYDKMHLYPSYIKSQFATEWLGRAYYANESQEAIQKYLKDCAKALANMKNELSEILKSDLKEQSDLFWDACDTTDTKTMLEVLKKTNKLKPVNMFIGINNEQVNKPTWVFIKFLHRLKSIIKSPTDVKDLLYIYKLGKKSEAFLKS